MSDIVTLNGYKIKDEKAVRSYDTVALMKADSKLKEGYHVKTKGYYEANDGGNGEYIIVDDETLVEDGVTHILNNGLRAKLIIKDNIINMKQVGCSSTLTDNSTIINTIIQNYCNTNYDNKNLYFPCGRYNLTDTIEIIKGNFIFDGGKSTFVQTTDNIPIIEFVYPSSPLYTNKIIVKNLNLEFENQQTESNGYGIKFDHMVYNSCFENISIYKSYIGIGCSSSIDEALWKISWKQILINNFYYRGFDLQANSGGPQNYFENIYFQCGGVTQNNGCCLYSTNLQAVIDNIEINTNTNGCNLIDLTSSTIKIGNFTLEDMTLVDKRLFRIVSSTISIDNMLLTKYKGTFGDNTAIFQNYKSFIKVDSLKIAKDSSVASGNITIVQNTNQDTNKTIINNISNPQNNKVSDYILTASNGMSLVEVKKELPINVASLSSDTKMYGDLCIAKLDDDINITFDNSTITGGFEYDLTVCDFNSHIITLKVPYYNGAFVTWDFTLSESSLTNYKIKFVGRPYKMGCILLKNGNVENSIWI